MDVNIGDLVVLRQGHLFVESYCGLIIERLSLREGSDPFFLVYWNNASKTVALSSLLLKIL